MNIQNFLVSVLEWRELNRDGKDLWSATRHICLVHWLPLVSNSFCTLYSVEWLFNLLRQTHLCLQCTLAEARESIPFLYEGQNSKQDASSSLEVWSVGSK